MPENVTVHGFPELKKAFEEVSKRTGAAVQKRVLMKYGELIAAQARADAPVYKGKDTRVLPGYLRDSIRATTVKPKKYKSGAQQAFATTLNQGGSKAAARRAAAAAGSSSVNVFIGPAWGPRGKHLDWWNEFGTKHTSAQPFLRPAMDLLREKTRKGIGEDMMKEIEIAAKRAWKKKLKSSR